jgi:hypothetical protein
MLLVGFCKTLFLGYGRFAEDGKGFFWFFYGESLRRLDAGLLALDIPPG